MTPHDADVSRDDLRNLLLDWYRENGRDLPWRHTTDPYAILVSEMMLQQTPVDRVLPKYRSFLDTFPAADDLAAAPLRDILTLWSGLGYNRRAGYLKRAAEKVVEDWDGTFPRTPEELRDLPGVGPYTANAVASFAFDNGGPVFDTNVRRLLYRHRGGATDAELKTYHETIFPRDRSRDWNNAVMELGSQICTPGRPRCGDCPWRPGCTARRRTDFSTPDITRPPRFEGSRRQVRGRIIRALTDGPRSRDDLAENLSSPAGHDLDAILRDLVDEGLVEESGGTYRLPV